MKSRFSVVLTAITWWAALAMPLRLGAQDRQEHMHKHHHYKLIDMGTLGGPQSYGDAGHGAANINNRGTAAGVADTTTPDPNYPNFNPLMLPFGPDPFIFHAFRSEGDAIGDLGALPGANSSSTSRISSNGLVVGQSITGAIDPQTGWLEENAVLWEDDQVINLGTLGGYESGAAFVNSRGQVVGFSGNAIPESPSFSLLGLGTETRAFLWQDGKMQDLGTLGGPDAFAIFVNERGQVAGVSYPGLAPSSGCLAPLALVTDAFLWEKGKMVDLGNFGGTCTIPNGINNRGQIVGQSNLTGDAETHAFLWEKGTLADIGTLGGTFGSANSINEAGEVAGGATTAGDQVFHAFFWRLGALTDIGTVSGFDCSNAFDINSEGQVVGQLFPCNGVGNGHAFLWENRHIIDLNVFVPPGSNLILGDSEKLNDRGEIFGSALLPNGDNHAFLLIPCDENQGDSECEDEGEGTAVARGETNHKPNVVPLENVRKMLRQRLGSRYHIPGLGTPKN
jgi:probable HAF family extracellular repeat protein